MDPCKSRTNRTGDRPWNSETGKASDHMAQKVTVFLDFVEKGKAGNRAIINYNYR